MARGTSANKSKAEASYIQGTEKISPDRAKTTRTSQGDQATSRSSSSSDRVLAAGENVTTATPRTAVPDVQLTWRDYDPQGGLPVEGGDIAHEALQSIFSEPLDDETANWILRLVNWRRQSGALIDEGIVFEPSLGVTADQADQALQYLRRIDPGFDEQEAGVTWAEEQIQQLSSSYVERAEQLGLYARNHRDDAQDTELPDPSAPQPGEALYGRSELVAIRTENEAKHLAKKKADEAAAAAEDAAAIASGQPRALTSASDTRIARQAANKARKAASVAWRKSLEDKALASSLQAAPEMSLLARLGPSTLLALLTLLAAYVLHENYVTPPTSARMLPEVPASWATMGGLVASMAVVALAYRFPPLYAWFGRWWVATPARPVASSVVLSTFTHAQFSHLFFNMALMWGFGIFLHDDTNRGTFLAVFLAAGTLGNYFGLVWHVLRRSWNVYSYGSSTSVYGVVTAACLLRPEHDAEIMGHKLPLTGMLLLGLLIASDVALFLFGGAVAKSIGFASHVGGGLAGAACAGLVRWEKANGQGTADGAAAKGGDGQRMDGLMRRADGLKDGA